MVELQEAIIKNNVKLAQDNGILRDAMADLEELVEGLVDIDKNGSPNLAMKVQTIVRLALRKE